MLIAVPTINGQFCGHFGGSDAFEVFEIGPDGRQVNSKTILLPPAHEHGVLPMWLSKNGVGVVIAGNMGQRARDMLNAFGITVVLGTCPGDPELMVESYLNGTLQTEEPAACDHHGCDH